MNINENVNFNAPVVVKVPIKDANGVDTGATNDVVVMYLGATLDTMNMNVSISANMSNKELALANKDAVKSQYSEFELQVKNRAIALGYPIY